MTSFFVRKSKKNHFFQISSRTAPTRLIMLYYTHQGEKIIKKISSFTLRGSILLAALAFLFPYHRYTRAEETSKILPLEC